MTKEEIQLLKEKLPRGWTTRLSQMSGISVRTVWKVFNGQSSNRNVLEAAVTLIEEENEKRAKFIKLLRI